MRTNEKRKLAVDAAAPGMCSCWQAIGKGSADGVLVLLVIHGFFLDLQHGQQCRHFKDEETIFCSPSGADAGIRRGYPSTLIE